MGEMYPIYLKMGYPYYTKTFILTNKYGRKKYKNLTVT
jgi:hypothetical protein